MQTLPATIQTTLHTYSFDTSDPDQLKQHGALVRRLESTPGRGQWMNSWGGEGKTCPAGPVTIETAHIFGNQWNTGPTTASESGHRVFDWYQEHRNDKIKRGHWLEITPEMVEIRGRIFQCGYCGKQHDGPTDSGFCSSCLDSQYLKREDLHLLRLLPVSDTFGGDRPPLTAEESDDLVPRFKADQIHGSSERGRERLAKLRDRIERERDEDTEAARTKADGLLWCLDRGVSIDNLIFYSHTGRFCFGWRSPLSEDVAADLRLEMDGFPFEYDIKTAD